MWKKGTLNLFERDYPERTGLKRGEKGKTNRKRVDLARDLNYIRKGEEFVDSTGVQRGSAKGRVKTMWKNIRQKEARASRAKKQLQKKEL